MKKLGIQNGGILYCRGAQPTTVKGIFCGREIVLQNSRSCGRALIKMFCCVTFKKQLLGKITICLLHNSN